MKWRPVYLLIFCSAVLLFLSRPPLGYCLTLITPEEAAKPDAPLVTKRGFVISQQEVLGPKINIFTPKADEKIRNPFFIEIRFEKLPDKVIDFQTLKLKYIKFIPIDLTKRVLPFLQENRLTVKDVDVPQGKHKLRLSIAYATGETSEMEIVLNVEK